MNDKKRILVIVLTCVFLSVIFTLINLLTHPDIPEGVIRIECKNDKYLIKVDEIKTVEVSGQMINGKGEARDITKEGILLSNLISEYCDDFSKVKVISDDEYYAELSASEILNEEKAYILITETTARLLVFGDKDSKRNVSNVKRIVLIK